MAQLTDEQVKTQKDNLSQINRIMDSIHDQSRKIGGERTGLDKESGVTVFKHAAISMVGQDIGKLRGIGVYSNFHPSTTQADAMLIDFVGDVVGTDDMEYYVEDIANKINEVLSDENATRVVTSSNDRFQKVYSIEISTDDMNKFVKSDAFDQALDDLDPRNVEFFKPREQVSLGQKLDMIMNEPVNLTASAKLDVQDLANKTSMAVSSVTMNGVHAAERKIIKSEQEELEQRRAELAAKAGIAVEDVPTTQDYTDADAQNLIKDSGAQEIINNIPGELERRAEKTQAQIPQMQEELLQAYKAFAEELGTHVLTGQFTDKSGGAALIDSQTTQYVERNFSSQDAKDIIDNLESNRSAFEGKYHEKFDGSTLNVDVVQSMQDQMINSAIYNTVSSPEFRNKNINDAIQELPGMVKAELEQEIDKRYSKFLPKDEPEVTAPAVETPAVDAERAALDARKAELSGLSPDMQDKMLETWTEQIDSGKFSGNPMLVGAIKEGIQAIKELQEERSSAPSTAPAALSM